MNQGSDNVVYAFSDDELNAYFNILATNTGSSDTSHNSNPHIEMCVAISIGKIITNAALACIPLVSINLLLPLIVHVFMHLFNFILIFSAFSLDWKIFNVRLLNAKSKYAYGEV
jgi:hypothetical protein